MEEYMERRSNVRITVLYILPLVLVLFGCVAKIPLQTPVKELSEVDQDHGVVVGSVLVRGPKFIWGGTPRWTLNAKRANEHKSAEGEVYSIEGAFGDEQIIVARMPVGEYYFTEFRVGKMYTYIDERFTVHPAKTVYIGRLHIEVTGSYLTAGSRFMWKIEDVQEQTLASAEETYGRLRIALTDLIGKIKLPQTFEKVWYRSEKGIRPQKRKDIGVLTIGKDGVEFHSKGRQLTIPFSSILDVQWGEITKLGVDEWVIVRFRVGGSEEFAAFGGHRRRSREIYRTLEETYDHYVRSEGK
jgi:hypothetical protein